MMKKKQIVDIAMVAALPFLMTYELIGEATHEILGIAMLALVVRITCSTARGTRICCAANIRLSAR